MPAKLLQLLAEQRVDYRQVHDIGGPVGNEFRCQRPQRPVGTRMRLVYVDIEQGLHESRIADLRRLANKSGRDLGVEQRGWQALVSHPRDFQVLFGCVQDPEALTRAKQIPERPGIETGKFVDAVGLVACRNLDQAQAWRELRGAHEFSVDGDQVAGCDPAADSIKTGLLIDEYVGKVKDWHKGKV